MKEVILLCGPMGTGKSTYCKEQLSDYYRISQDDMGKDAHLTEYLKALDEGKSKIVVDRINHIREQRRRYLDPAKERGYRTKILVMNHTFSGCHKRLMKRTGHPTLNMTDEKHIISALSMYFNQYEYVQDNEANEVIRIKEYDPFLLDITGLVEGKRIILIGDVHGCFDQVQQILADKQYDKNSDVLIFAGDLVDRGPKIKEVLEFVKANDGGKVFSVMSNHEHKYLRFLRGNKVNTFGLKETLDQVPSTPEMRMWLESLPYIIKFGNNYVCHAGMDPTRPSQKQRRDTLMYARTFNPVNFSVTEKDQKPWYSFQTVSQGIHVYFGHAVHEKDPEVSNWATSLDGGCYQGNVLRAVILTPNGKKEIYEVKSTFKYEGKTGQDDGTYHPLLNEYEELVKDGYLSKSEKDYLMSYKYTDACTFEKKWNPTTRRSRGIIIDRRTGEIVARPFEKFFNLGEMPESYLQNLPSGSFVSTDKVDGSLGIMYWYKGLPNIATCGSFYSEQAVKATWMLQNFYDTSIVDRDLTLLFEIIYPANKIVCNYGNREELVLLGAIDRFTGEERDRHELCYIAEQLGCNVVDEKKLTIDEMIANQKILPFDVEGYVIRFDNGLRVKIKGEDYLRIHKALSGCTPLNIWKEMLNGRLPDSYRSMLPEEVLADTDAIASKLIEKYNEINKEIIYESHIVSISCSLETGMNATSRKLLGLYIKDHGSELKHASALFPFFLGKGLDEYIMRLIRPTNNVL